jgi:hypothetical protein
LETQTLLRLKKQIPLALRASKKCTLKLQSHNTVHANRGSLFVSETMNLNTVGVTILHKRRVIHGTACVIVAGNDNAGVFASTFVLDEELNQVAKKEATIRDARLLAIVQSLRISHCCMLTKI